MSNTFDATGRVVKDGEIITTVKGDLLAFSVAEDYYRNGEVKGTNFWPCSVFGSMAKVYEPLIKKGQLVRIIGSAHQETYEKNEVTHMSTKIFVRNITGFQGYTKFKADEVSEKETSSDEISDDEFSSGLQ